jgi:hypothetical protein
MLTFNYIILRAKEKYIPKGYIKKYNTNFTRDIARLIKERKNLKRNNPIPHTQDTVNRITRMNGTINSKILTQKTQHWQEFVGTLNHNTDSSKLDKTLRSLTNNNTGT